VISVGPTVSLKNEVYAMRMKMVTESQTLKDNTLDFTW
jgi:hypothetical protein